jgi:hypothetical protein
MAYDEGLAERIRDCLQRAAPGRVVEKAMFGGLCFMIGGNMACGIAKGDFMARFSPDDHEKMLARPGARPMDFTKKIMLGMAFVGPEGVASDAALQRWVDDCVKFTSSLPVKVPKPPKPKAAKKPKPK